MDLAPITIVIKEEMAYCYKRFNGISPVRQADPLTPAAVTPLAPFPFTFSLLYFRNEQIELFLSLAPFRRGQANSR